MHHAFTSPKPESLDTFDTDPGSALAYAYDIVCNGNEIGGGSIRIHRRDVQERVFAVMGLTPEEAQTKFGFLLDAFKFGAPPHGGIAFGWDRICALLSGTDSIRDVIAFPKTGGGYDPLTGAPAPITPEQRKEAGIDDVEPPRTDRPLAHALRQAAIAIAAVGSASGHRSVQSRGDRSRKASAGGVRRRRTATVAPLERDDLDLPAVVRPRQPAERPAEPLAQLRLARQPDRVAAPRPSPAPTRPSR